MENEEQSFVAKVIEAISELQAQGIAHGTMLEAMLMAHPDPGKLRDCWDRISAPRRAANGLDAATKARPVDQVVTYHLANWTKKLDSYFPRP